jgi:hypothetical protein
MKRILLVVLMIVAISCNKNSKTTPPSSTPPPTTTSTWTTQLLGDWILRRSITYDANGKQTDYCNFYNPSTCHLDLTGTQLSPTSPYYNSVWGLTCAPLNNYWNSTSTTVINFGASAYGLNFQSNDSLVIYNPAVKTRYLLNKTGNTCVMSAKELSAVKNWSLISMESLNSAGTPTANIGITTGNYLNLQSSWNATGGIAGWVYSSGGSYAFPPGNWKIFGNDTLSLGGALYTIDTVNSSKLVFTYKSSNYVRFHLK